MCLSLKSQALALVTMLNGIFVLCNEMRSDSLELLDQEALQLGYKIQNPVPTDQNNPWISGPYNKKYQFHIGQQSWLSARELCLSQNSDLLTIRSEEELDWILSHYKPHSKQLRERQLQLGLLIDSDNHREWKWVNGESLNNSILQWASGEPFDHAYGKERCAILHIQQRKLDDVDCDMNGNLMHFYRFVCERTHENHLKHEELNNPLWKKLEDILVFFGISSPSTQLNKTEEELRVTPVEYDEQSTSTIGTTILDESTTSKESDPSCTTSEPLGENETTIEDNASTSNKENESTTESNAQIALDSNNNGSLVNNKKNKAKLEDITSLKANRTENKQIETLLFGLLLNLPTNTTNSSTSNNGSETSTVKITTIQEELKDKEFFIENATTTILVEAIGTTETIKEDNQTITLDNIDSSTVKDAQNSTDVSIPTSAEKIEESTTNNNEVLSTTEAYVTQNKSFVLSENNAQIALDSNNNGSLVNNKKNKAKLEDITSLKANRTENKQIETLLFGLLLNLPTNTTNSSTSNNGSETSTTNEAYVTQNNSRKSNAQKALDSNNNKTLVKEKNKIKNEAKLEDITSLKANRTENKQIETLLFDLLLNLPANTTNSSTSNNGSETTTESNAQVALDSNNNGSLVNNKKNKAKLEDITSLKANRTENKQIETLLFGLLLNLPTNTTELNRNNTTENQTLSKAHGSQTLTQENNNNTIIVNNDLELLNNQIHDSSNDTQNVLLVETETATVDNQRTTKVDRLAKLADTLEQTILGDPSVNAESSDDSNLNLTKGAENLEIPIETQIYNLERIISAVQKMVEVPGKENSTQTPSPVTSTQKTLEQTSEKVNEEPKETINKDLDKEATVDKYNSEIEESNNIEYALNVEEDFIQAEVDNKLHSNVNSGDLIASKPEPKTIGACGDIGTNPENKLATQSLEIGNLNRTQIQDFFELLQKYLSNNAEINNSTKFESHQETPKINPQKVDQVKKLLEKEKPKKNSELSPVEELKKIHGERKEAEKSTRIDGQIFQELEKLRNSENQETEFPIENKIPPYYLNVTVPPVDGKEVNIEETTFDRNLGESNTTNSTIGTVISLLMNPEELIKNLLDVHNFTNEIFVDQNKTLIASTNSTDLNNTISAPINTVFPLPDFGLINQTNGEIPGDVLLRVAAEKKAVDEVYEQFQQNAEKVENLIERIQKLDAQRNPSFKPLDVDIQGDPTIFSKHDINNLENFRH